MSTINLGGKDWDVAYGKKARREIETKLGKGLWQAIRDGMVVSQATIIWAGIKHADRKLGVDTVIDAMESSGDYEPAVRTCIRALLRSAPFGKPVEDRTIDELLGEDDDPGKA